MLDQYIPVVRALLDCWDGSYATLSRMRTHSFMNSSVPSSARCSIAVKDAMRLIGARVALAQTYAGLGSLVLQGYGRNTILIIKVSCGEVWFG